MQWWPMQMFAVGPCCAYDRPSILSETVCLQAMLYCTLASLLLGACLMWLRMRRSHTITSRMHQAYRELIEDAVLPDASAGPQDVSSAIAALTAAELRRIHKFKDVTQVSLVCRGMRQWDEDGIPLPGITGFGEFVIKVDPIMTWQFLYSRWCCIFQRQGAHEQRWQTQNRCYTDVIR